MYNKQALAVRRCQATRRDGLPCQQYAVWGSPQQLCYRHGGRVPSGVPHGPQVCRCSTYAWPHRAGSGWCVWPLAPIIRDLTPAGTRGCWGRWRRRRPPRPR